MTNLTEIDKILIEAGFKDKKDEMDEMDKVLSDSIRHHLTDKMLNVAEKIEKSLLVDESDIKSLKKIRLYADVLTYVCKRRIGNKLYTS